MAEDMTRAGKTGSRGRRVGTAAPLLAVSAFCLLHPALCCAEELADPTRPPALIAAPADTISEEAPAAARLQSIIISKTRRAAIIGGETVELGGKYGDAKLIEVNEGSVILRNAQGRQVLTLFPDVKMTAARVSAGNEEQRVKTRPQSPKGKAQPEARKASQTATMDEK